MTNYKIFTGVIPAPLNMVALRQELATLNGFIGYSKREATNQIVAIFEDSSTATQNAVNTVLAVHDGLTLTEGQEIALVRQSAENALQAIPNWSNWDEPTYLDWHDTNIDQLIAAASTLEDFRAILEKMSQEQKAQSRMLIAFRNASKPELQNE